MFHFFLGALGALVLVACQPKPSPRIARPISSIVVVADASTSSGGIRANTVTDLRCPEVTGSLRQALTPSTRHLDVLVLATGGKETASEPRVLVPWLRYQPTVRLFGQTLSKYEQERAFLTAIETQCRSALKPENTSPIVAAVSRAALSLTSHCEELIQRREVCSSRQLVVLSDLRENVEGGVKQRFLTVSRLLQQGRPLPSHSGTLPTIPLSNITTVICGLGEHVQTSDDVRVSPEAVVIVWRELLGTAPTFSAACHRELEAQVVPSPPVPGGVR